MTGPITLRLSVRQANYLYYELRGLLDDYTQRQLNRLEPEDFESAMRQVVNDVGKKLADAKLQLDLAQLRKLNSPTPNDKNS